MATRQRKVKTAVEGSTLTFNIMNGDAVHSNLEVDVSQLPQEIQKQLMLHGAKQKLQDSAAGAEGPESVEARIQAVAEQLRNGQFNVQREGGGGAKRTTQLAKALSRMYGIEVAEAEGKIAELSDDQVDTLRKNARVKAAMAEIRAEEAAAKAKEGEGEGEDVLEAFGGKGGKK